MYSTHRLLSTAGLALLLGACDKEDALDTGTSDCDGNGEWNDEHGHCHCDDGYILTDGGLGCTLSDDTDDTGNTGDDTFSFAPDSVEATVYGGDSPAWVLLAKDDKTWLSIENYPDYGGPSEPSTRILDDVEINYATCGVCLILQTGCEPHGDHAHCDATFMPEAGGEVIFDALGAKAGESWSGSLSGVRFVEVEINGNTYETTPVDGGDTLDIDTWSFDVVLEGG